MRKPTSLKTKFILVITLLLLSIFIANGFLTIRSNIATTEKNLTSQATAFAELSTRPLAEAYDLYFESGYYKFWEIFDKIAKLDKNITKIQFIDMNGKVILDSNNVKPGEYAKSKDIKADLSIAEKVRSNEPIYVRNSANNNEITEIIYPYYTDWGSHAFSVRYFVSYEEVRQNIIAIIERSIILMLIFLILSVGLITISINQLILAPIALVNLATQKISKGKYGERVNVNNDDEIGQLADATNKMAGTLERNINELKELDKLKDEFVDIAAHNLKIPLTHLKANIAYLINSLKEKIDSKSYALVKDLEVNSNKLQLLSEDLINISALRKEAMQSGVFMPADLVELLKTVIDENQSILSSKNMTIKRDFIQSAPILAESTKLKQVFANLIDNAVKFSPTDSVLNIRIKPEKSAYQVDIVDHGVGMTEEETSKLFQKFYQAPSSAAYNKEGTGLGLYLSKLIVEVHHGKITVSSKQNEGSTFSVLLPQKEVFKKKLFNIE